MEKPSTMRHHGGVLRLPPGFRFHPTDEELVVQYLTRKVFAYPLPASIIPDINLGSYNPWDLPGSSGEDRYFFNLREAKYPTGNRSNRATGSGYWKATGKDKAIVSSTCNQVVGMKKVLVFYQGKPPNGSRTDWIMHEYRLAGACNFPQRKNTTHNTDIPMKDWVLCRIFKKKRASKMECEDEECAEARVSNGGIRFIDFMGRSGELSSSSCVTDISDESGSGDETSTKSSP